ncbi:PREDICTED: transforming growth factor-beta receptor-associated protein 1 homolog [Rhagoletis zephyria]|uniref:transforming growth factor-beta receptor-associated protein 1 homolog n=1 Tax=Rhagoletis zephyria TaxID=28612 RepID=UPI00081136EF|nr:PREDICTED: transforming growth factor-beta receptor-associated protein 1 homolog [Rhagoletis zephyria]
MDVKRFEILPVLESVRLNEKINFQITCLEVNNNDVYLGTADGFVLCYQDVLEAFVTPQPTPQHRYMSTKKAVTQIKIAPILERILCVYDATFVALNLNNLEVINSLRIKNIYSFCLNENPMLLEDPFTLELCLVKKKSVCIYHLQADKLTLVKEVTVPEQPILVAMDGYFVCMAAENNYYMLDWQSGECQQLISNDSTSSMSPVCKHVARNEFLINGLSHLGVFVNTSGISERPPIDWGMDVKRIAYSYPFILCLKQYSITIISVIDSQMKEEIPFENGAYIDNFDGKIVIASSDSIFYLRRLPWEEQIDSLLDSGKSQEAIELCDTLSENGLISNRDFENTKLVQVKAELEELSQDNESAFLYGQTGDHAKKWPRYGEATVEPSQPLALSV